MKFRILLLLSLWIFAIDLSAQEVEEAEYYEEEEQEIVSDRNPMFSLGLEFDLGIPLNNFKENLDRIAFGGGGYFLVRTNPSSNVPVFAGLSGRVLTYDSERQNQIILIDGFSIDAELTTRNSIFMGHGMIRILPPVNFSIQPFFDGMLGFNNLFTRTTLEEQGAFEEDNTIDSYIEQGDWALSYGGAVGFQMVVGGQGNMFFLIEGRCTYLRGNAADYLVRIEDPNVQITDTIDAFEEKNSTTDMLIPQIGVSFVF